MGAAVSRQKGPGRRRGVHGAGPRSPVQQPEPGGAGLGRGLRLSSGTEAFAWLFRKSSSGVCCCLGGIRAEAPLAAEGPPGQEAGGRCRQRPGSRHVSSPSLGTGGAPRGLGRRAGSAERKGPAVSPAAGSAARARQSHCPSDAGSCRQPLVRFDPWPHRQNQNVRENEVTVPGWSGACPAARADPRSRGREPPGLALPFLLGVLAACEHEGHVCRRPGSRPP